jgi:hypothetical protein
MKKTKVRLRFGNPNYKQRLNATATIGQVISLMFNTVTNQGNE